MPPEAATQLLRTKVEATIYLEEQQAQASALFSYQSADFYPEECDTMRLSFSNVRIILALANIPRRLLRSVYSRQTSDAIATTGFRVIHNKSQETDAAYDSDVDDNEFDNESEVRCNAKTE
ncbi:unnamed protein product [Amoebophrya sp. A25]|nr:unnamed protein product [Amoebophrya sp. A25]|eukprot:GSA25T00002190001.1